ncbi:MAG: TIGR03905 family TSCPD domain-containing protein [Muribaculaceae bacterium]|nr:TIGR03905 family TSCPD domain-containing protein [Muribaculaceae bacterium]
MKTINYITTGTCSRRIDIVVNDDNSVESVIFHGGCNGNTQGISMLVKGMQVNEVIERLEGITCGNKSTSCPDQLAAALKQLS